MTLHAFLALFLLLASWNSAMSATLALYNFTGQPGNQASTSVTSTAPGITAGAIVRGAGLNTSSTVDTMNSSLWTVGALVASNNDYYEFSITPGASMTIERISFGERRSAFGIGTFELRSSLDSFGSAVVAPVTVPDDTNTRNQELTLPGSFANLSGPVTFRLYGYNAESTAGTWRLENHSTLGGLVVEGSVIPEPSAAALAILGAAALVRRRRTIR